MDPLLEAISKKASLPDSGEIPVDERTFSVLKKFLKGKKEGDVVSFKILLEDGDNAILMPDEPKPETEESLVDEITTIKAMKENVKRGDTKPKTPSDLKAEAERISDEEGEEENGDE